MNTETSRQWLLQTMKLPRFTSLQLSNCGDGCSHSYAQPMHSDPRFYKYLWWVFWENSPLDGAPFLRDEYSLNTFTAMSLANQLSADKLPHWIYNQQHPRFDPGVTPFDRHHPRWRNTVFAPALSQDPDPEWCGYR
ncbi:MAG: hypothetical protein QUV35_12895 [Hydrogenophaga sp.]|uniref:hypothetical protein n=1 Tax=Hydrogenophaga sp. TaxID=1904254 RepID=UPI0026047AC9|nr:hypothetical protein [Hydrogenophaga sp.]MDM7943514.1 hypothetical protein [Hydrogenophaga sp.]